MPRLIDLARERGVSAYVGHGAHRRPALRRPALRPPNVRRPDAARFHRPAL
ncbi:hypothetical protein [Streptomyces sp. NPDC057690]|uniref:hypothetical protein n=1 Tax=Streptomyces sp. NPDC057690 TaxID=3346214 RepID=UPI0036B9233F